MDISRAHYCLVHDLVITKCEAYGLNKNNLKLSVILISHKHIKDLTRINNRNVNLKKTQLKTKGGNHFILRGKITIDNKLTFQEYINEERIL